MIPAGMIDLLNADDYQMLTLYLDLTSKKQDPSAPRPSFAASSLYYFKTVTRISRNEAIYAIGTPLAWRHIKIEPTGEGFVKVTQTSGDE